MLAGKELRTSTAKIMPTVQAGDVRHSQACTGHVRACRWANKGVWSKGKSTGEEP